MKEKLSQKITQNKWIIRNWEKLYTNKLRKKRKKFLETYNLPRLNHEEIGNLNRHNTNKETESLIKNLPMIRTMNDNFHRNSTNNPKICIEPQTPRGFPDGSDSNASACNAGDLGSICGSGRSPQEGNSNPLQYSCLQNSMDGGAWWATVHGVAKS